MALRVKPVVCAGDVWRAARAAIILFLMVGAVGCVAQHAEKRPILSPSLRYCATDDLPEALERTVTGLYAAISFPPGERPSISELKRYFAEQGVLANLNGPGDVSAVDDFIENFLALHRNGAIASLHEREAHHVTCVYGRVAHRFSFYEARGDESDAAPFAVGVNSIQLVRFGGDWKVTSWAWHDDAEGRAYFNSLFDPVAP